MSDVREYRPELLSRRGEWLAWFAGIGLVAGLILAGERYGRLPVSYWVFAGLMIFLAISISLGNWMDRRSVIHVNSDGIAFENGLRSVSMHWSEIRSVVVSPTRMGKRVQVEAVRSHFEFKTMWRSSLIGQEMRTGFPGGQLILETILRESGLQRNTEKNGMEYYARP
jgi:hypothetical protein